MEIEWSKIDGRTRFMEFKLVQLYPKLMSLYGEWGNVAVLRRHLEDLGHTVVLTSDPADILSADFVFMGAGTERSSRAVLEDFRQYREDIAQAMEIGTPMLFTGTAMDLLGRSITDAAGAEFEGLGLWDFTVTESDQRILGDVLGTCGLTESPVVGFMNKCGLVRGIRTPFLIGCEMGFGNDAKGGSEGLWNRGVLGTHLTGPLLAKNPRLADFFVEALCNRWEVRMPEERPNYLFEERGYQVTVSELRKLLEKEKK